VSLLAISAGAFLVTLLLSGVVRFYAARALLDVPNARSSHSSPTPRGGGLAIAVALLASIAAGWAFGAVPRAPALALIAGGGVVATLGWLDDHRDLPVRVRLPLQVAAAGAAVYALGGLPELSWGAGTLRLGGFGALVAVLGIVWSLNLFNFMDGIDGIAAGEALSVAGWGGVLLLLSGEGGLAAASFAVAAAAAGFVPWNWMPARIFMGDVGSGLLGYVLAVVALASERAGAVPLVAWAVLYGVFVFDATATLLRRLARGERVYQAHRSHAYQRLTQSGWSHGRVSGAVLALNLCLAGLAFVAVSSPERTPAAVVAALALLAGAYLLVERRRPM
jgi:Fuc2NAc and GlcNAc transferase